MSPASSPGIVPEVLDEYGEKVRDRLQRFLASQRNDRAFDEIVEDYPNRSGRMLRPALLMAVSGALGGRADDALDTAVALELLHNAFLVHDDIEDGSEVRRGRPALHQLHGIAQAINAGDALSLLSLRALLGNLERLGTHLSLRIMDETVRMATETVRGQATELAWRQDNTVVLTDADYLQMILKKTCWYSTIFPSRVGALIASGDRFDLGRLTRFGFFLGATFQLQDDLLNLDGDPERYGKEINGDLWEGKRTLMLIHLARSLSPEGRMQLGECLARPRTERTLAEVRWMRKSLETHGSLAYARRVAHGLAGAALHEFEEVFGAAPDSRDLRFLAALPAWMIERD